MSFRYSSRYRTLIVVGSKMNHYFDNVNASEINQLIEDAKFKEACWRE